MTDTTEQTQGITADVPSTSSPKVSTTTKSASVQKLLSRNKGATLGEIMAMTSWQPHSARAFLTGLRKKGITLIKETRTSGETSWRIER